MAGDSSLFTAMVIATTILAWLAFASCGVSLFSPAWITMTGKHMEPDSQGSDLVQVVSKTHIGLVVFCMTKNVDEESALQDCTWFKEGGMKTPDWMAACRALVGAAVCVFLVAAACSNVLFFKALRNPECSSLLIASSFLGLGAIVSAVVTFGMKANQDLGVEMNRNGPIIFDWGYYVAIIAAGISLCAFTVMVAVISLITTKGQKKYSQIITPTAKA